MPRILWFTDSKGLEGYPSAATYPAIVNAARTDYTGAYNDCLPGRDTGSATLAALTSRLSASGPFTHVVIDLAVNDPLNGLGYATAGTVTRLNALRSACISAGATPILLTPMHCLSNRGSSPNLDYQQFLEAVAEGIRKSGWDYIDVRKAVTPDQWLAGSDDLVHPKSLAVRTLIANYIIPRLP